MSTAAARKTTPRRSKSRPPQPRQALSTLLENGDRLTQPEFHRRYETYPEDVKFELIGGVVYMASPLFLPHSRYDGRVGFVYEYYCMATPGVETLHNSSIILSSRSEPQPDLGLRILPEFGGQSIDRQCKSGPGAEGAVELLTEISSSTRAIDMHAKKEDYEKAGVQEYLVVCVEEQELHWFNFKLGRELHPNTQGIYKSRIFPGLWIDGPALLALDSKRLLEVLQQGLASREHATFIEKLRKARR